MLSFLKHHFYYRARMGHQMDKVIKKETVFMGKMRQDPYHRKHLIFQDRKGYPESADVLNI